MDQKIKVIGTGLSGLVGSRVVSLLSDEVEFEDLSLDTGVDITNFEQVKEKISSSDAPVLLHMAAKTDVDSCEDDKLLREEGQAWIVNVEGTANVVQAARLTGKKVIYISTGFVFNGSKDYYTEEDEPDPINWYAQTKYEGEKKVLEGDIEYIIARIDYPYCAAPFKRKDFAHKIIERFKNKEKLSAVTDSIITPSYIDDIARGLGFLLKHNLTGIYHLVGSQSLSPFESCEIIAHILGYDENLITKTTRNHFFKDRAFRPFKLALKNDKITKFGIKMRTFEDGIKEFRL